jgi:hypothetical protein
MREYGKIAGIAAAVVLAVGLLAWWIRSKRTRV